MSKTYELWDIETGNIIGDFTTEEDALDVVQTLLNAYGPGHASALTLSKREGGKSARVIGSGQQITEMLEHRELHDSTHAASRTGWRHNSRW